MSGCLLPQMCSVRLLHFHNGEETHTSGELWDLTRRNARGAHEYVGFIQSFLVMHIRLRMCVVKINLAEYFTKPQPPCHPIMTSDVSIGSHGYSSFLLPLGIPMASLRLSLYYNPSV